MANTDAKHIQRPNTLIYPIVVIAVAIVLFILVKDFIPKNQRQYNRQPTYAGKINSYLAEKLKTSPRNKFTGVYIEVKAPPKSPYPTNLEFPPDPYLKCLNTGPCPSQMALPMVSIKPTLSEEQYADVTEKRKAFDKAYDEMVEKIVQRVADRVEAKGYKVTYKYHSKFSRSLPPEIIEEVASWGDVSKISEPVYTSL